MILKESLFNKAVFKTTLRRFKWGSLLYFIMLFLSGPFVYLTKSPSEIVEIYYTSRMNLDFSYANSRLMDGSFVILHILFAIAVPTVVALLVYNYVHSSRHGVFVHSLPISRKANFFSTLCAAFVLMFLPVILNGLIFIIMSLFGYAKVLGVIPSFVWILINLFTLFVMFAIAAFCAFLTGSSFALVAINALVHSIPFIIYLAADFIGSTFVFGYEPYSGFKSVLSISPLFWLLDKASGNAFTMLKSMHALCFIIAAVVFYILAFVLYKHRKIELCGDVAGFRFVKPILKYMAAAFSVVVTLSLFKGMRIPLGFITAAVLVVSAIVYFGTEMILRKSMKVLSAYKGYIVFVVSCCAVLLFSAYTSFFGYETYIPGLTDIEKATVYTYYDYNTPYVIDKEAIENIRRSHSEMLRDIPVVSNIQYYEYGQTVRFEYELKNGKRAVRVYLTTEDKAKKFIGKAFENKLYREELTGVSHVNIGNLKNMNINIYYGSYSYSIALNDDAPAFMEAVKKDIDSMTYEDFSKGYNYTINAELNLTKKENDRDKIFINFDSGREDFWFYINITPEFKNTVAFLEEKGYNELIENALADNMYIAKDKFVIKEGKFIYKDEEQDWDDFRLHSDELVKLEREDAVQILAESKLRENTEESSADEEYYYIFCRSGDVFFLYSSEKCLTVSADSVPEYLKKYLK